MTHGGAEMADLDFGVEVFSSATAEGIDEILSVGDAAIAFVLFDAIAVLVSPGPVAFAEGIVKVLKDPSFAGHLGTAAQNRFEKCFSYQIYLEKTAKVITFMES